MSPSPPRPLPNILITGTPATGKTTLCETILSLASTSTPPLTLTHLRINDIIKSNPTFHSGAPKSSTTSSEDHALIVDDDNLDSLMDHISSTICDGAGPGGFVIDWHSSSGFATRWIDLVVVVTCADTTILYDRLQARGYGDEKMQENIDAEIFGVVAEEAREGWEESQVVELRSERVEDVEENAERVLRWIGDWMKEKEG